MAGYRRTTETNTHTPQHPNHEWRGAAVPQAQAHTPTPQTPARSGGVQAERAHKHTHAPTAQPGVAGCRQNPSASTHTHTAHPSQEWRGTSRARTQTHTHPNTPARSGRAQQKTRAQGHTPTPQTPARSGGVQAERAHKHTHTPTPQPGVVVRSRNPSPQTQTHAAHPSQAPRIYGVQKSQNQLQSEILLFLSNYTIKSIFSGVSPPPPHPPNWKFSSP